MALLHDYGTKNQVVSTALDVYTTKVQIGFRNGSPVYECHRIASKQWEWIGMDEATARACAVRTRAKYSRDLMQYYNQDGSYSPHTYSVCAATVNAVNDDGGMWHVTVDVSEDQCQYTVGSMDVSTMWDTTCDYDESSIEGTFIHIDDAFRIDGATIADNKVEIRFDVLTDGFSVTSPDFHLETAASASPASWTDVTNLIQTRGSGMVRLLASSLQGKIRLRWKSYPSNIVDNPSRTYTRTVTISQLQLVSTWEIVYAADFPDFNQSLVRVLHRVHGSGSWDDITSGCNVSTNLIRTSFSENAGVHDFMVQYSGTNSNVVSTPYDPSADVGDGTIVVMSAYPADVGGSDGFQSFLSTTHALSDVYAQYSVDGVDWSELTLVSKTMQWDVCPLVSYYDLTEVGIDPPDRFYVKFFHDVDDTMVQGSRAYELPLNAAAGAGEVKLIGIYPILHEDDDEFMVFKYSQDISGFDPESADCQVEMSTNGGITWEVLTKPAEQSSSEGNYVCVSGLYLASDTSPRIFRMKYGNVVSNVVKYPLAGSR